MPNASKLHIKSGEYLLGEESDNVLITQSIFNSPAIYFAGATDSGKSSAAMASAASLLLNDNYEIYLVDTRFGSAYRPIQEHIKAIYSPNDDDGLNAFSEILKTTYDQIKQTSKIIAENKCLSVRDLREKGIAHPVTNKIIIVDEASEVLKVLKTDTKELQLLKANIIQLIYDISKLCRNMQICVMVCNQSLSASALDLDLGNFTRVLSRCDQGYSQYILGNTLAFDAALKRGRFIVRGQDGIFSVKFPLLKDGDL